MVQNIIRLLLFLATISFIGMSARIDSKHLMEVESIEDMVHFKNNTDDAFQLAFADLAASVGAQASRIGPGEDLWHSINFLSQKERSPEQIVSYWKDKLQGVLPMISTTPTDNGEQIYGVEGVAIGVVLNAKSTALVCHAFCDNDCGFQNPLGTHEANGVGANEGNIPPWKKSSKLSNMRSDSSNFRAELERLKAMVTDRLVGTIPTWIAKSYFDADSTLQSINNSTTWLKDFSPTSASYPEDLAYATEVIVSAKLPAALKKVGVHFKSARFDGNPANVPANVSQVAVAKAKALQTALKNTFHKDIGLVFGFGNAWREV